MSAYIAECRVAVVGITILVWVIAFHIGTLGSQGLLAQWRPFAPPLFSSWVPGPSPLVKQPTFRNNPPPPPPKKGCPYYDVVT